MTEEAHDFLVRTVTEKVDAIIALADPEEAHSQEDALYATLLAAHLSPDVYAQVKRLKEADFPRWYA